MLNRLVCVVLLSVAGLAGCGRPNVDPDSGVHLKIAVIEDRLARTAESAVVRNFEFWEGMEKDGHAYQILDMKNEAAKSYLTQFDGLIKRVGLPIMVITRPGDGKLLANVKLPDKTEKVAAIVNRLTGRSTGVSLYTDSTGEVRCLGMKASDDRAKERRKRLKSFGDLLKERQATLIPEAQWIDVDHPKLHAPEFVLNQRNSSGCVGWSEAAAQMKLRELCGMPFVRLSGAYTYAHINHGSDSGAMILDAMVAAAEHGHALESQFDYPRLFLQQIPKGVSEEALTRQSVLAYPIDTIEELGTAIQLGFIVQAGVQVDGSFERFDSAGVSSAGGRYANHSIHVYGMKRIGDRWCYRMGNTWGETWGPFRDGSCYLTARGLCIEGDAFVHCDAEWPADKTRRVVVSTEGGFKHVADHRFALAL